MLGPLMVCLPNALFPNAAAVAAIREPSVGMVIPDLLFGQWPAGLTPTRQKSTIVEAHIAATLERVRRLSACALIERLSLTPEIAARSLASLVRRGVLERNGLQYSLCANASTATLDIVAVEVKLSRWREALAQASHYRTFADRSYVVLDGSRVLVTPGIRQAFRTAGVGLFGQTDTQLIQYVRARARLRLSSTRVRAADALFGIDSQRASLSNAPQIPARDRHVVKALTHAR